MRLLRRFIVGLIERLRGDDVGRLQRESDDRRSKEHYWHNFLYRDSSHR